MLELWNNGYNGSTAGMTPDEEREILKLNEKLSGDIAVRLFETEHEKNKDFNKFCDHLSRLVPKIHVAKEDAEPDGAPMIGIGSGLRYQAIPTGTELGPFLEALSIIDSVPLKISEPIKDRLRRIDMPAILEVYVAPQCRFCPEVVRRVLRLPNINSKIQITVIDCIQFPEAIKGKNIQAVPTIILDDQFRWTGLIQLDEIIDIMVNRDPSVLGASSLEMILKNGNAFQLAEMMLAKNKIFPALYDLLTHHNWPVRLGAMVVMEELIDKNLELATRVQHPLWQRFHHVSDQIKGDILYIFGELGQIDMVSELESVLNGQFHAEVKEAAYEALEKLRRHAWKQ